MAKRFESQEDLDREKKAIDLFVGGAEGFFPKKMPPFEVDFAIASRKEGNRNVAYVEIKGVKKVESVYDKHNPVVSVKKLASLQKYVNERKCPTYVVWAYSDGIKYANLMDLKGVILWSGQLIKREGSANDHELMFINTDTNFKIKTFN